MLILSFFAMLLGAMLDPLTAIMNLFIGRMAAKPKWLCATVYIVMNGLLLAMMIAANDRISGGRVVIQLMAATIWAAIGYGWYRYSIDDVATISAKPEEKAPIGWSELEMDLREGGNSDTFIEQAKHRYRLAAQSRDPSYLTAVTAEIRSMARASIRPQEPYKAVDIVVTIFVQFEDGSPSDELKKQISTNPIDSTFHVCKLPALKISEFGTKFDATLESSAKRNGWSKRELSIYKANIWAHGARTLIDLAVLLNFNITNEDEFQVATFAACSIVKDVFKGLKNKDSIFLKIYGDGTVNVARMSEDKSVGFYGHEDRDLGNYRIIMESY